MATRNKKELILIELNNYLSNLEIWGIVAGFGSLFYIHIGEKIKREQIIPNNKLLPLLREYEGFYMIGVMCGWRLEKKDKIILSHIQDEAKYITPGLSKHLIGQNILAIKEIPNSVGLSISVTDDITLTLFYDSIEGSNWVFFKEGDFYCGMDKLKLKVKK